jgi:glycosyltransferase involved in cell wall biosynthesis
MISMKIMHVHLSREFAGSEMYCASLAAAQAAEGREVRVVVRSSPAVPRWKQLCGGARVLVIPWWMPSFMHGWVAGWYMLGFEPDVVHTHLGRADARAGKAARQQSIPWVTTVHLRWKPAEMAKADGVLCIAKWQKPDIAQSGYKGALRVVWNWLPPMNVAGSDAVASVRDRLDCTAQTVVFGSVGRLHGQKGFDVLVKAFRDTFADDADVRLVIAGEGAEKLKLQGLIGPDKRIVLVGYQTDLAPWYEAFDAYVSAARYEPFGLTILEAMAHGCHLVCTRTEGPSEFLQDASGHGQVLWAERGDIPSRLEKRAGGRARPRGV